MLTSEFWVQLLTTLGYALLSSIIPVFNSEAFVLASQASGLLDPLPTALGLAIGHIAGKWALFQAVRQGRQLPLLRRRRRARKPRPETGKWAQRWWDCRRRWRITMIVSAKSVEQPHRAVPVLLASALFGIPPVYLTTLFAGTTRIKTGVFVGAISLGLLVRNFVFVFAVAGVIGWWR